MRINLSRAIPPDTVQILIGDSFIQPNTAAKIVGASYKYVIRGPDVRDIRAQALILGFTYITNADRIAADRDESFNMMRL